MADNRHTLKSRLLAFVISEPVVLTVLLINTAIYVALAHDPDLPAKVGPWIGKVDVGCVVYFIFEACVKIVGQTPGGYFKSHWNKFDFVITSLSAPVLVHAFFPGFGADWSAIAIVRLARVLRVLRMVRYLHAAPALLRLQGPIYTLLAVGAVRMAFDEFVAEGYLNAEHAAVAVRFEAIPFFLGLSWLAIRAYGVVHLVKLAPLSKGPTPKIDGLLLNFIQIAVNVTCLLLGVVFGLKAAGYDPYGVMAGVGIGGMAIAFASQDTIANVISGIILFIQRPFRIGERLFTSGVVGRVETIGLRTVSLRKSSGELVSIPNRQLIGGTLTNIDACPSYQIEVVVRLPLNTAPAEIERAMRVMREVVEAESQIEKGSRVLFKKIGIMTLELELEYHISRWVPEDRPLYRHGGHKRSQILSWVNLELARRLHSENITLAQGMVP